MRHFHRLCSGLNVTNVTLALARQPELWNRNTLRTKHPATPHAQVDDVWLRFASREYVEQAESVAKQMELFIDEGKAPDKAFSLARESANRNVIDEHESVNYPAFGLLPATRPIIFDLMRLVEGERLGRVIVTRLAPGARITPHVDGGSHAAYYDRYHVALRSEPGVVFRAGAESIQMLTGEVWWFDNGQEHEVINNSAEDRITLIVDIRTNHGEG